MAVSDYQSVVDRLVSYIEDERVLFPDTALLAHRCVSAVLTGHLILQGPPGTGKTTLARLVAKAFDASSDLETATADWSTFDVIGGFVPSVDANGREVLAPWLGHVTRAANRCVEVVRAWHKNTQSTNPSSNATQAHWLIIDEFSRAEMDKAVGALYSALGNSKERVIRLWFMPDGSRELVLPRRFRLIGTMNDVDSSFVYSFSRGLGRRFQFVDVLAPDASQRVEEVDRAETVAVEWVCDEYPALVSPTDPVALKAALNADPAYVAPRDLLGTLFDEWRHGAAKWTVGTAQMIDVLKAVMVSPSKDAQAFDRAVGDRLVSQLAGLRRPQLEAAAKNLNDRGWSTAAEAALGLLSAPAL